MACKKVFWDSGNSVILSTVSDTTISKWDVLDFSSWYVQRATSSSTDVHFIADESKTTAAWEHEDIACTKVSEEVYVEADTNGNTAQDDIGTYKDLTDHDTLNESASTNNVFFVTEVVWAAADKKVRWYFVRNVA